MQPIGKLLIFAGVMLILFGLLFSFSSKLPFGKLPGDIIIKKGNFTFYFPLATSILLSIILTVIMYFLNKR
ncbi:MAG: DUF2905 domain-containing protein [Desulfurella sp.]|jgi:hypothetical protein|uniref:DUF2905 domain-containing protein n=1 Tax=Desulfurella multipotens TaxID=79269 RepID=A0A1G6IVU9_9BACT|nr:MULTISPECIES: DUF2905 domain-containing protein [Desulfurella]AHF97501.1 hypothetical protein DESACE_08550 [Desulfurella acetivorans A63]HEX14197.1 DUF2905 domain-containing protein [Desulfurella acetivorans]PMP69207.1 MAG: DUF2905 domain-containing protein [Desulfurella multipotens]PMP93433.1 MAG: DUF2905 domain-containing protein [Desulfurella sp.]SDC10722.1 Protein of unknown function [Desulfurella multipotens]